MGGTAVVAQARMGSTRLPGKVLMRLGDRSVLAHVLRRASAIPGVNRVCVATSALTEDDAVAEEADRLGALVFRGEEHDVLQRYLGAARMLEADTVMRLTCDCPLIDPEVCGDVLRLRKEEDVEYASNVGAAEWPHGLDCEAFTRELLERAGREARSADEREHVTLWMRRGGTAKKAHLDGPGGNAAKHRWVLDYPEDFDFLQALFAKLPPPPAMPGWRDICSTISAHPDLMGINRGRAIGGEARVVDTKIYPS